LEPLLKRLPVHLVGGVFYGDGVVTLADFTALLALDLALLWNLHKSMRGSGPKDKLRQIIMHQTDGVSSTSTMQRVLKDISSATNLVWRMSRRILRDWAGCVLWHILEDPPSLSTMSSSSTSVPSILDVSSSPVYWYPRVSRTISGCTLLFIKLKATCSALSRLLSKP
jgi:hypothetical protein